MNRIAVGIIAIAALLLAGWGVWSWGARNPEGLALREVGENAGHAYVFGYPLVLMDETRRAMLSQPDIDTNSLHHVRELPGPEDIAVVRPNRDTLYSIAWLDLSQGPVVLQWPELEDRYWLFQALDAWTDVVGTVGSRTHGQASGAVQIVGPDWQEPVPAGMSRIRSDTSIAWILGRIAVAPDEVDLAAGRAFQDAFSLTSPSVTTPSFPILTQRPPDLVAHMPASEFFERLAGSLVANPARAADSAAMQGLASLGVAPGEYDPSELGFIARRAMDRGVEVARARMAAAYADLPSGPSGWRTALDLGDYGTNYPQRAIVALIGLGANLPEDAIYPFAELDNAGRPLSGDQVYRIHFAPGQLPPADAFWSVTAYGADGFLQDVGQSSIGDRDALAFDENGGLTLHVSARRPAYVPNSNWIEVRSGERFQLTARLYDPAATALSGAWLMPPVEPLE